MLKIPLSDRFFDLLSKPFPNRSLRPNFFVNFRPQDCTTKRKKKISLGGRFHGQVLFDENTGERIRIIPSRVVDRFYRQKDPRLIIDEPPKVPLEKAKKRKIVDENAIKRINSYLATATAV